MGSPKSVTVKFLRRWKWICVVR